VTPPIALVFGIFDLENLLKLLVESQVFVKVYGVGTVTIRGWVFIKINPEVLPPGLASKPVSWGGIRF
jgi:hypothetical protein